MKNCTLIGKDASCPPDAENALVVGDWTWGESNSGSFGETLFGEEIPTTVKSLIISRPQSLNWLLSRIVRRMAEENAVVEYTDPGVGTDFEPQRAKPKSTRAIHAEVQQARRLFGGK